MIRHSEITEVLCHSFFDGLLTSKKHLGLHFVTDGQN